MIKTVSSKNRLENPIPHLQQAQSAVTRIIALQKELMGLKAEQAAKSQYRKIGLAAGAGVSAFLAIFFFFAWLGVELHNRGIPPLTLAGGSLFLFGIIAAILTALSKQNPNS